EQNRDRGQPRQKGRLDVAGVDAGNSDDGRTEPEQQQQCVLGFPAHRPPATSTRPTAVATNVATTKVAGANRVANARPNIPVCIANSFTSTAGPTTRNTNRGTSGSIVKLDATNASASEHSANTTANSAMVTTPSTKCPARWVNTTGGTSTCMAAAAAAPSTKYEAAWR